VMVELEARQGGGTGKVFIQLSQMGAIGGAGVGIARGSPTVILGSGAILIGPNLLARIMTNPTGVKLLTTGLKIRPGTEQSIRIASRLIAMIGVPRNGEEASNVDFRTP
ncbi:hypothetical protein LCGC14_2834740, partial [marine sediment metagenome]